MSPAAIDEYLSQVAPVPFSPEFGFADQLVSALTAHTSFEPLDIRVNDAERPVYRPYRDQVVCDERTTIKCHDLSVIEVTGVDGDVAALAWVAHHEYEGAIPSAALIKGLRLRAGNVQVGDNGLLEELFPEPRFNAWSIGEIHVFDRRIVPNGRRDQFEQNAYFHNLLNHLTPLARDITRRCRTSSIRRKLQREFDLCLQDVGQTLEILKQGGLRKLEVDRLVSSAKQKLSKAVEIAQKPLLEDESACRSDRVETYSASCPLLSRRALRFLHL